MRTELLGALLAASCRPDGASFPDASDRTTYQTLLEDRSVPPSEALPRCGELEDPALAGDCGLALAARASVKDRSPLETWCPQVPGEFWRQECWFQAAEQARRANDPDRAAALCQQSGPFIDDCGQHLWQTAVRQLVQHHGGAPAFATIVPEARVIYASWAPLLSSSTDFEERFWIRLFQNGFELSPPFDLGACDRLEPTDAARCRRAGLAFYAFRLEGALHEPLRHKVFCGALQSGSDPVAAISAVDPGLQAVADPELREVVRRTGARGCRVGPRRPPPGGLQADPARP